VWTISYRRPAPRPGRALLREADQEELPLRPVTVDVDSFEAGASPHCIELMRSRSRYHGPRAVRPYRPLRPGLLIVVRIVRAGLKINHHHFPIAILCSILALFGFSFMNVIQPSGRLLAASMISLMKCLPGRQRH